MAQKNESKILGMERDTFRSLMGKYGVSIVMLVMIIVIGIVESRFLSPTNLINVATRRAGGSRRYGSCHCQCKGRYAFGRRNHSCAFGDDGFRLHQRIPDFKI